MASADDVATAAAGAAEAQRAWAATPHTERAAVLRRAGDLWQENAEEFSEWNVREVGAVGGMAAFAVGVAAQECYEAAALASQPPGQILHSTQPRLSLLKRVPAGVVGVITPWNFPLILSIRAVAPALALGNAVVLKPDRAPRCGRFAVARVFEEAGLPDGLAARAPRRRRRRAPRWSTDPTGADDLVHRLDRGRPQGRRARRAAPQAGPPRAGWQLGADRDSTTPTSSGRGRRRVGLVPAPGPDLHDRGPAPRARGVAESYRGGAGRHRRHGCRSATRPPTRSHSARSSTRGSGTRSTASSRRTVDAGRTARVRRHARRPVLPADRARQAGTDDARLRRGGLRPGRAGRPFGSDGRGRRARVSQ